MSDKMKSEECELMDDNKEYQLPRCNHCEMEFQDQSYEGCESPKQGQISYRKSVCSPPAPRIKCEQDSCLQNYDSCCKSCASLCYQPQPDIQAQVCDSACNSSYIPQENCYDPCTNICRDRSKPSSRRRRRYIQPPRRQSFKPSICYKRPEIPMSDDTVYRRSFEGFDAHTAACCRAPPMRPNGLLRMPCTKFEDETITKLSFQPYCRVDRARPIVPQTRSLLGKGPMQALTTQKHDFVPKFQYKRMRFFPHDNIRKINGCFEKETVQRLSFMPPCVISRAQSCKPTNTYKCPEVPMENETVHKLSYAPVCPLPREELSWAQKAKYKAPTIPFANDTITRLSYQPPGCYIDENDCCYDPCNQEIMCDAPRAAC